MNIMNADFSKLVSKALETGAFKANVIPVSDIETNKCFRDLCKANACGNYGKNWTCPPLIGEIDDLMNEIPTYKWALVYQTVSELEDSYDFEGMIEAGNLHNQLVLKMRDIATDIIPSAHILHLGAGGCRVCPVCAKRSDEPCRHPDLSVSSLEAYGINVSRLAEAAGMKYINGQNTVTYFGAVLFG